MVSAMRAALPLLSVAVVCGQPPWQQYTKKYSGGEAQEIKPGTAYQQKMNAYTHAAGNNSNTTGFGNYENNAHQYAGSYEKYMSSADQSRSSSKAGGNIPSYSKKFLDKNAKGFEKYTEAPKNASYMQHAGAAGAGGGDYAQDYKQYMKGGANGAGSQAAGGAKGSSSGDYSQYYKKYMSQAGGSQKSSGEPGNSSESDVRAYYKHQYMKNYAPKVAQEREAAVEKAAAEKKAAAKKAAAEKAAAEKAAVEKAAAEKAAAKKAATKKAVAEHAAAKKAAAEKAQAEKAKVEEMERVTKRIAVEPAAKQATPPAAKQATPSAAKQATPPADARRGSSATQQAQKAAVSVKAVNNLRQQAKQSVQEQLITPSGSTSSTTVFFAAAFMAGVSLTVFSVVRRQESHFEPDNRLDHYFLQA